MPTQLANNMMASQLRQQTPPGSMHPHHVPPNGHPQMNGHVPMQPHQKITTQHMAQLNEATWLQIGNFPCSVLPFASELTGCPGNLTELMGDLDGAVNAYEQALRHNQFSVQAMNQISCILRTKENFPRAVEYLQAILKLDATNGEVWGSLGNEYKPRPDYKRSLTCLRSLLSDDGRSPTSILGVSTSFVSPTRS